jgi:hemoglobin/transferrin/lactoferrin receptor protein
LGWQKWSLLSSFSYSDFDDLKMGKNGRTGQDNYLRPEYVERINNKDSIVQNSDPRVQRFSGYNQTNFCKRLVISPIKTGICNTFLRMPAPAMHLATTD